MKRLLNILFLSTLAWPSAYAQEQEQNVEIPTTVTNVSYIHRNDDHFHGFADSEVDSITFSRIDADGIEHADYVMQIVYTPDSIYHIPLAVIDSVQCQQPAMELQEDVVMLTADQRGFVVRADSTTILFRSDTPRQLLPDRGKVLLAMSYGGQSNLQFAGRVLKSQRTPEGVLVTCDPGIQLGDIFRRLTTVMFTSPPVTAGSDEQWDVPHSGNREKFDPFNKSFVWEPKTRTFTDSKTGEKTSYTDNYVSGVKKPLGSVKKDLFTLIPEEKKPSWMKHNPVQLNVGADFNLNYRQKFIIDFFKDKDDWILPSLYFYWRPTLLPSVHGYVQLKIEGEYEKEITVLPDVKPIGIWTPPVPPAIPPIRVGEVNFHVTPLFFKIGGEAEVNYNFTIKKLFDVEVEHNSSGTNVVDMTKNGGYTDKSGITNDGFSFGDSDLDEESFEKLASFYCWFGWKPSVGVSLITEKVLTAFLELKVGPWFQLNIERTKDVPSDPYTRFYERWSPTHLLTKMHLEGDFKVVMAKGTSYEKNFSLAEKLKDWNFIDGDGFDFNVHRYGIFPSFGKPALSSGWEKSLAQRGIVSFTTSYGNPNIKGLDRTLLSADLGLGLYKVNSDGTQSEVATSFSPKTEKGWFSEKTGSYTTEFKNVKRGVFKVAPLFDAAIFDPIRATTEADVTIPPSAVTEDATSIGKHHCFLNGYALGLKEFADLMGGTCTLGWILKKADENQATMDNLTIQHNDKMGTFNESEAVSETVNGEDKLSFGPQHSTSKDMESKTRCDGLTPATNYIYRTWAAYTNGMKTTWLYGETKELITDASEDELRCCTDLGLSVDWACYNVGAAKEYQYGNYYAWGEKETKKEYTAAKYKLPGKEHISGDTNYDVATTWNRGKNSGWRMPTKDEIQELIDNCEMKWTTVHKVQGMLFTSKINGNKIFLPAAGNKYAKKTYSNGIGGCYWSGDLDPESLKVTVENATIGKIDQDEGEGDNGGEGGEDEGNADDDEGEIGIGEGDARELTAEEKADAWRLHFNNVEEEGKAPHNEAGRCFYGRTIRPVREKEKPKEP